MKYFQAISLFLAAIVAQSNMAIATENIEEITAVNFTVIATLPKSRSIGARNTIKSSTFAATWDDAIAYCFRTSSVFISIMDHIMDETIRQGLISNEPLNTPMWTSGRYSLTEDPSSTTSSTNYATYVWAGNGRQVGYENWDTIYGEPRTGFSTNTCIATIAKGYMNTQYAWQTDNCSVKKRFLCLA